MQKVPSTLKTLPGTPLRALGLAFGLIFAAKAEAQLAVVPFNAEADYQKRPHAKVKRVLLYNYSHGVRNKAYALNSMTRLANKYGFQLDVGTTSDYLTEWTLKGVDVVVFNNGEADILGNKISLLAMRDFIEGKGKGLLQIYAAASYIPCPTSGEENLDHPDCKWLARVLVRQYFHANSVPTPARIYADSVTAGTVPPRALADTLIAAIDHGRKNPETVNIFKGLPKNGLGTDPEQEFVWDKLGEAWYNYRGSPRLQGAQIFDGVAFGAVNVLLSLDESSYAEVSPTMGDHPMAWARKVGNGLTAYINAGHSDVYVRPRGTVDDSLIEKINWNIIRYLARDFVGCMDPEAGSAYNPDASVTVLTPGMDDPAPCEGVPIGPRSVRGRASPKITLAKRGVLIPTIERETYRIVASNSKGRRVFSAAIPGGPGRNIAILEENQGIFFIEVESPSAGKTVTKVHLE